MGVATEAKRTEAKDPPILQPDKKAHSPPSTRNRNKRRLCQAFVEPPNSNQEYAGVG